MAGRLTDIERADRKVTGAELQGMVGELGALFGWAWIHIRPAQTSHGWRTPVEGPLGKGWPDMVLVNATRQRTLAIEIKREVDDALSPDQRYVHGVLEAAGWTVRVWRPSDLTSGAIQAELSR